MDATPKPPTLDPTPREARMLKFISGYRTQHGYSPTLREIGAELGCSHVTAHEHVTSLARKGYLTIEPNVKRGAHLTDAADRWAKPQRAELTKP